MNVHESTERGSSEAQIEVTPQMMAAGFRVLATSGIADDYLEGDKLLLADIYRAMHRESQGKKNASDEQRHG